MNNINLKEFLKVYLGIVFMVVATFVIIVITNEPSYDSALTTVKEKAIILNNLKRDSLIKELSKEFLVKKDEFSKNNSETYVYKNYAGVSPKYCNLQSVIVKSDNDIKLNIAVAHYSENWIFATHIIFVIDDKIYEQYFDYVGREVLDAFEIQEVEIAKKLTGVAFYKPYEYDSKSKSTDMNPNKTFKLDFDILID